MSKDIDELTEDLLEEDHKELHFICANCGKITQKDVMFLCNTCDRDELIYKDGVYMCPTCLEPGENFECLSCGSKDVQLLENISSK
jgi:predicted RNA-binding Zn-ribbon protein involved in translation (DUF1610 family)